MYLDPFEGPWLKVERARSHFADMVETIVDYQSRAQPEFVKTDRAVNPWEIAISEAPPKVIALQLGDIAHSLRSPLDVMLCDIAVLRGAGLSDMAYPFANSEAEFKDKLEAPNRCQPFKKLGEDIVDLIAQSQPFRNGNVLLRGLHDLNNQDKHRMAVPHVHFVSCTGSWRPYLKKAGLNLIGEMGEKFALDVGEPILENIYMQEPADSITFNQTPVIVCFPNGFVLIGDVIKTMGAVIDEVDRLLRTFQAKF